MLKSLVAHLMRYGLSNRLKMPGAIGRNADGFSGRRRVIGVLEAAADYPEANFF
jgi:hypothetical protein